MKGSRIKSKTSSIPPAVYMIIIMILYFGLSTKNYFTVKNATNIIIQAMPLLVAACGQTLIVLIQGTDLSIGANMNLTMVVWFLLMKNGISTPVSMIAVIILATFVGCLNGVIVANMGLPSFIATLGTANICSSLALTLSNGSSVCFENPIFKAIAKKTYLGLPLIVYIGFTLFVLFVILLECTRFGARIRALGGNAEALHVAGYSVNKANIQTFTVCGFSTGIAALLLACRVGAGNPSGADGYEFTTVAAVLLGGTSMVEGRGNVTGTLFGVLLIQILKYSLVLKNVSAIYQKSIIGGVVLLAVIFDAWLKNREEGK